MLGDSMILGSSLNGWGKRVVGWVLSIIRWGITVRTENSTSLLVMVWDSKVQEGCQQPGEWSQGGNAHCCRVFISNQIIKSKHIKFVKRQKSRANRRRTEFPTARLHYSHNVENSWQSRCSRKTNAPPVRKLCLGWSFCITSAEEVTFWPLSVCLSAG